MRVVLLRRFAALLTGLGRALGMLGLAAAPAQTKSFGVSIASSEDVGAATAVTFTAQVDVSARAVGLVTMPALSWSGVRFAHAGAFGEILEVSPQSDSASTVVDNWITSKTGHYKNLMSANWAKTGVGVTSGVWQKQNSIFSKVDFQ